MEAGHSLRRPFGHVGQSFEIVGESEAIKDVLRWISKAAGADAPVLIFGESGTGKELVARALHQASFRSEHPFVAINCSAMPRELLESELFGHARGAFTGAARRRVGLFEEASGGTWLLDEIGDMALEVQAKLLRVLETGEYRRVGQNKIRNADVRVLAATNQDLEAAVRRRGFREDLYFRLNVLQITVPPLRKRADDIVLLATHFLEEYAAATRSGCPRIFSEDALECFQAYGWPGNVRELRNVVERLAILCDAETITPADLPMAVRGAREACWVTGASGEPTLSSEGPSGESAGAVKMQDVTEKDPTRISLDDVEKHHILRVLEANDGNKAKTARDLGIDPKTLYKRLHDYGL